MTAYPALVRSSYKTYTRDRVTVFFTFAFPLMFLVIFGLIYGNDEVAGTGNSYIDLIAPGILAWGLAHAAAFGVAFPVMQWRRDDLLRMIRLTPAPLSEVVLSRLTMVVGVGLAQVVLFVGVAMLPPFGMTISSRWPLAIPVLVLGIGAFVGLGLIIGTIGRSPESVSGIGTCIVVPMAFLSGALIPLELFPDWLAGVSYAMPMRYILDGLVYALAGAGEAGDYWISLGVLVVLMALFNAIGMRIFRWSDDQ
ncbi:ABC transporter permease [Jiangella alba]|uniref:Transport permease protein n=1 Tax=Jiangella alba TaxID=561176 RepID=A0A1H5JXY7_9ACTN|nr:ABC transporter permease [Jiangella alba]SEE57409.1 ABC-2 type transport system permease protein [Jiangella alba]